MNQVYMSKGYKRYGWTLNKIGYGAYSTVYSSTVDSLAIKVYLDPGADLYRELTAITLLNHPYIVKPTCITRVASEYWLYTPLALGSLNDLYVDPKIVGRQLYCALAHCHKNGVIHRDVKPQNILVYSLDRIALTDFGLSRTGYRAAGDVYSGDTCTLWWRAPEILLGSQRYTFAIDVWAAAVVLLELLGCDALHGCSTTDQITRVYDLIGVPDSINWPGARDLPNWWRVDYTGEPVPLSTFTQFTREALDFFSTTLTWEPKRVSAEIASAHEWFALGGAIIPPLTVAPQLPPNTSKWPCTVRAVLIEWIFDLSLSFGLYYHTVLKAIGLFDKYLSATDETTDHKSIQKVSIMCVYLANKLEEIYAFTLEDLDAYMYPPDQSEKSVQGLESRIHELRNALHSTLVAFDFNLNCYMPKIRANNMCAFVDSISVYAVTGSDGTNEITPEIEKILKELPGELGEYYRGDKIYKSTQTCTIFAPLFKKQSRAEA